MPQTGTATPQATAVLQPGAVGSSLGGDDAAEMAFSGDWLVFSNVGHLRRRALSPSAMLALDHCPGRWAAEATIPRPESPFGAAELGTAAHAVLEAVLSLPPERRNEDAAWGAIAAQVPPGEPVEDLGAWCVIRRKTDTGSGAKRTRFRSYPDKVPPESGQLT